ncbi:hypothetical protein F52700_11779 [Fusarium sp. NRRL 52700]|nr:hypothetical protein F52700_11779 [Fusarium sp. NRRL 52700]
MAIQTPNGVRPQAPSEMTREQFVDAIKATVEEAVSRALKAAFEKQAKRASSGLAERTPKEVAKEDEEIAKEVKKTMHIRLNPDKTHIRSLEWRLRNVEAHIQAIKENI